MDVELKATVEVLVGIQSLLFSRFWDLFGAAAILVV